jgi:hypothetical protein
MAHGVGGLVVDQGEIGLGLEELQGDIVIAASGGEDLSQVIDPILETLLRTEVSPALLEVLPIHIHELPNLLVGNLVCGDQLLLYPVPGFGGIDLGTGAGLLN